MGRIKWNLDMLEEVRMQHEEAMTATEQVINKGRSDLSSMTEEVWEGEDGDMARDQLHDLLNKEMVDTWKQLDACNEAIQKAQKTAYESKNFCNRFPQIFSCGSMPSDSDQGACSGDLLCDSGNCSSLKDSMTEAGQNAVNVKSKVESAESILSELETDEAKFDYSSYTQPIKEQTQKVAERTGVYNTAVSRYEQKTQEMDDTFSNELIAATPTVIPEPFDPSCLDIGDQIHMKDGDIINFLEEYNAVEMGSKLSDAQLENILAMLFDKKDIDVSSLSEKDFGMAFITLPEEQKKAVLMEMGYSREQVESILESFKGKNASAAGAAFARTLFDRIAGKNGDKYHNSEDKTGLAKALGLAGLRRPGEGIAKTNAETYAGDEKTFGKASEETKKEHEENKNNRHGKNPGNDSESDSDSGNSSSSDPHAEYKTGDSKVDAEIDRLFTDYGEDLSLFRDKGLEWDENLPEVTKKALARIAEVDLAYINNQYNDDRCAINEERVGNILSLFKTLSDDVEETVFSEKLNEMYNLMTDEVAKQYLTELSVLKRDDFDYFTRDSFPKVRIDATGVIIEMVDIITGDVCPILCHTAGRNKEKVIATNLDTYLNILCDDDDSNDEAAIKELNEWMEYFIIGKDVDGKRCVAYDKDLIESVLPYLNKDDLAYQLFTSLDNQILEKGKNGQAHPEVIAELAWNADVDDTILKIGKYGAGVTLTLISDYNAGIFDDINKEVAYAVTETSLNNYFYEGGELDWDNISEWLKLPSLHEESIEYGYFAKKMLTMTDEDMEKILLFGQIEPDFFDVSDVYKMGKTLPVIVDEYRWLVELKLYTMPEPDTNNPNPEYTYFVNQETRAIALSYVVKEMKAANGCRLIVELSTTNDDKKIYTVNITAVPSSSNQYTGGSSEDNNSLNTGRLVQEYYSVKHTKTIDVYPRNTELGINGNLAEEEKKVLKSFESSLFTGDYSVDDLASFGKKFYEYVMGKEAGDLFSGVDSKGIGLDVVAFSESLVDSYINTKAAQGASNAIDLGTDALSLPMSGTVVYSTGIGTNCSVVENLTYDEKELAIRVASYNSSENENIDVDALISSYNEGGNKFKAYDNWYRMEGGQTNADNYEDAVIKALEVLYDVQTISDASAEQLDRAIQKVDEVVKNLGYSTVTKNSLGKIKEALETGE